jgi:hypothetical protein
MSEIELLRAEATRCRQLAYLVIDQRVEQTLLQMASECEYRADEIISENVKRANRMRALMAEPEPY